MSPIVQALPSGRVQFWPLYTAVQSLRPRQMFSVFSTSQVGADVQVS